MGHADIQTPMIYVHHVPQADAADKLSRLVAATSNIVPVRDTFGTQMPIATRRPTPKMRRLQAFRVGPLGFEPRTNGL